MKRIIFLSFFLAAYFLNAQPKAAHNLNFPRPPARWDEALPLGNSLLGCLVWQKENRLRLSLDRADLWDLRPMPNMHDTALTYQWVAERLQRGEYALVQQKMDVPYEENPAPSKLPGAALEFAGLDTWGASTLDISTGLATVSGDKGLIFKTFVHAKRGEGWFRLEGASEQVLKKMLSAEGLEPFFVLLPPPYKGDAAQAAGGSVAGDDLARLGYMQTDVRRAGNTWIYHQPCWGGFSYQVALACRLHKGALEGVWSISSHFPEAMWAEKASKTVRKALKRGFDKSFAQSKKWWDDYWAQSSLQLPDDPLLERQYFLDSYKFGCLARMGAPMISLQGVWTADNGRLPPWKGDFHHDLNTEQSYWHAYTANHVKMASGYLRHLRANETAHRAWTKRYFGNEGLNIPGVETLMGEPMGGWIQYSGSPTTAAWLAQHFYLHWRYTLDRVFLKGEAYPFLHDVAVHLASISFLDKNGVRVLPLSSSPEIGDNSPEAWFPNTMTNYDLALTRFVFEKTAELAAELGKTADADFWKKRAAELPPFALNAEKEMEFAPGKPYEASHRHFSHLMALHPLGLVDVRNGSADSLVVCRSLSKLSAIGSDWWTGYSFAWQANHFARARMGAAAREALQLFAGAFVSKNSFHVNGDQSGRGLSKFTYRPFTLEGNFAAAAGLQEMLLQSHHGVLEIFPALPSDWQTVSFQKFRAQGAFVVSAERKEGHNRRVEIKSEQGGEAKILLPAGENWRLRSRSKAKEIQQKGPFWVVQFKKGGSVVFEQ